MNKDMRELFRREAARLLREAAHYAESEPGKSVWRAVDAVGILTDMLDAWQKGTLVGVTMPTGRGYRIVQAEAPQVRVRRVR
jgi:hypothetical protein